MRREITIVSPLKIPYDSLTLSAVLEELQSMVGSTLRHISQPDEWTIELNFDRSILLSCHPQFARVHEISRHLPKAPTLLGFVQVLRSRLDGAVLTRVHQQGFDRVAHFEFDAQEGKMTLIAELMGKHSNLILVDRMGKVVAAAKHVGTGMSKRPITPGRMYSPPPFEARPSILEAKERDDLKKFEGASPFLLALIEKVGLGILREPARPVLSEGNGAYARSVAALGLDEVSAETLSRALERHFYVTERDYEFEQRRSSLRAQLERVEFARTVALKDLLQAADAAARAREMQMRGELIQAYGSTLEAGATELRAMDYEGVEMVIRLDGSKNFLENAQKFFDRAKRAKHGAASVREQLARVEEDLVQVRGALYRLSQAESLKDVEAQRTEAEKRRWLHVQHDPKEPEKRPYEGKRVRELLGPGGVMVLYGENAEANDYLTLRVAKPDDWWLHVRGSTSAHVVIPTYRKPEKIGREVLEFAARVAVQNSVSKHSGFVPVDYTLRKYVRRPRGAKTGTVIYTHEKTIHVEP